MHDALVALPEFAGAAIALGTDFDDLTMARLGLSSGRPGAGGRDACRAGPGLAGSGGAR
ncbi:MAG: hypothetical protein ACRDRK_20300 [Pseudonocardia sp.]